MKTLLQITGFILILCLNVACADSTEDAVPAADDAAADSTAQVSDAGSTAGAAPSAGLLVPVDGSSKEAFEASLAEIKKNSTASEYTTLENSIEYLLVYDLSARRDRTKLAEMLNGQTGAQIIDRAETRRGKKSVKQSGGQ